MKAVAQEKNSYFVICGTGTELGLLQEYVRQSEQYNLKLIPGLPRQEYEDFVGCCDVGLIFLDYRFTIPNFPSRLLSYMQKSMPVLACTDTATDVSKVITEGGFGAWCPSNDAEGFAKAVQEMCCADLELMGTKATAYLKENYSVQHSADIILDEYMHARKVVTEEPVIATAEKNVEADQILFCRKCGEKLIDGSRFCRKCGTEVVELP
jgi:glycosyltransferase involved in cell wall biosynthesis/ribosomal protein L40E